MYSKEAYQRIQRRRHSIIGCLKKGMDTKQMSEALGVSRRTIQRDIKYIRENQNE